MIPIACYSNNRCSHITEFSSFALKFKILCQIILNYLRFGVTFATYIY